MPTTITAKRVRLARAIERDILRPTPKVQASPICFTCGRPFSKRGRFCSSRCREAFDAGLPPYEPLDLTPFYSLPIGPKGFFVECARCGKRFDSKGWRYCSQDCKRIHRERRENAELIAETGIEPPTKRKCQECGSDIPNWRNGRRVSKATRFCSRKCRDGARQGKVGFTSRNDEKVPGLSASGGDR